MKKLIIAILFIVIGMLLYKRYVAYLKYKNYGTINSTLYKDTKEEAKVSKNKVIVHKISTEIGNEAIIIFCYADSTLKEVSTQNDTSWIEHKSNLFTAVPKDFVFYYKDAFTRQEIIKFIMEKERDSTKLSSEKKIMMRHYDWMSIDDFEIAVSPITAYYCGYNCNKLDTIFEFPKEYQICNFNHNRKDFLDVFLYGIILSKRRLEMSKDKYIIEKRDSLAKCFYKQNEWKLQSFNYSTFR